MKRVTFEDCEIDSNFIADILGATRTYRGSNEGIKFITSFNEGDRVRVTVERLPAKRRSERKKESKNDRRAR